MSLFSDNGVFFFLFLSLFLHKWSMRVYVHKQLLSLGCPFHSYCVVDWVRSGHEETDGQDRAQISLAMDAKNGHGISSMILISLFPFSRGKECAPSTQAYPLDCMIHPDRSVNELATPQFISRLSPTTAVDLPAGCSPGFLSSDLNTGDHSTEKHH